MIHLKTFELVGRGEVVRGFCFVIFNTFIYKVVFFSFGWLSDWCVTNRPHTSAFIFCCKALSGSACYGFNRRCWPLKWLYKNTLAGKGRRESEETSSRVAVKVVGRALADSFFLSPATHFGRYFCAIALVGEALLTLVESGAVRQRIPRLSSTEGTWTQLRHRCGSAAIPGSLLSFVWVLHDDQRGSE